MNYQPDRPDLKIAGICIVCGDNCWVTIREAKDYYRLGCQSSYELIRCVSCGLVKQKTLPNRTELETAYSIEYSVFRPSWKTRRWPPWKILRAITTARRLSRLKRYGNGCDLLEVGCGAGDFLLAASRAGWQVRAVEYTDRIAEIVRNELGFDVRSGELTPGLWGECTFDVVAFWDVIEHLTNPLETLGMATQYLRQGGIVMLSIPTKDAAECGTVFGDSWALLDLPRHIHFLSRPTLSGICDKVGLTLVHYWTPLLDTLWCYFTSSWRDADRYGKGLHRSMRLIGWLILIVFTLPYLAVRSWRKHGMQAIAIAIKDKS